MVEVEREASVTGLPAHTIISWGAIFAGVAVILAASLLLTLFGAAIGFSIIDVTDLDAIGNGLSIGTAVWIFLSTLGVFFVGGLIAAHLSGRMNHASGMLHGVTVWAVAGIIMLVVDAMAMTSLVQTTVSATQKVASVTGSLGQQALKGLSLAGEGAADLAGSRYADTIRAQLKTEAARVIAETEPEGGTEVRQQEVRQAIEEIDRELLRSVADMIVAGDLEGARRELRSGVDLSRTEVQEIIDGVSNQVSESETVQQVESWLEEQLDAVTQEVAQMGGPRVDSDELQNALDQLSAEVSLNAGQALLTGEPERAKEIIIANTNLSENQVNAIVDGVSERLEQEGNELMAEYRETVEQVSDFVQWMLWLYFITSALSLGTAALGGYIGSHRGDAAGHAAVSTRAEVR